MLVLPVNKSLSQLASLQGGKKKTIGIFGLKNLPRKSVNQSTQ